MYYTENIKNEKGKDGKNQILSSNSLTEYVLCVVEKFCFYHFNIINQFYFSS